MKIAHQAALAAAMPLPAILAVGAAGSRRQLMNQPAWRQFAERARPDAGQLAQLSGQLNSLAARFKV